MPRILFEEWDVDARFPAAPWNGVAHALFMDDFCFRMDDWSFAPSWVGVASRFHGALKAASDYDTAFPNLGVPIRPQYRPVVDDLVFRFFTNLKATFENLAYSTWIILARAKEARFDLAASDPRKVGPDSLVETLRTAKAEPNLLRAFQEIVQNPRYQELARIRNGLSHRSAVGRGIHVGSAGGPVAIATFTLKPELTIDLTRPCLLERVEWAIPLLSNAIGEIHETVARRIGGTDMSKLVRTGSLT